MVQFRRQTLVPCYKECLEAHPFSANGIAALPERKRRAGARVARALFCCRKR
jgi:hypothetical protein